MYRTLTDPKLFRCLPHRRIVLYNIIRNLHGSFLNIIFQKNPPANIVFTMYAGKKEVMPTYRSLLQIPLKQRQVTKTVFFICHESHSSHFKIRHHDLVFLPCFPLFCPPHPFSSPHCLQDLHIPPDSIQQFSSFSCI